MTIDIPELAVIAVVALLCWWVNETWNTIPVFRKLIMTLIVVAAVLLTLESLGLTNMGIIVK